MESPFDHLLGGPDYSGSADDDSSSSGSGSPSNDTSSSPPPSKSPPPSSPPPPKSSGSGSPPPSPPQSPSPSQSPSPPTPSPPTPSQSPSPPTPSLSPPPVPPQNSGGSPPAPPLDRGAPAAPSRAVPPPPAAKHSSGNETSSSESGGSRRGKSEGRGNDGDGSSSPPAGGAIVAGVVIGVVAFGLLMAIVACVCCARRKKKRRPPHMNMPYYTDEHGNVFFANSMPRWQTTTTTTGTGGAMTTDPHGGGGWHAPYSSASGEFSGEYRHHHHHPPQSPGVLGLSKSAFSYDELASATGGFAAANLLGQGGFGYVYRGVLPGSGKEVAVKQLKAGSGQGEREFQAEVEIISRVHHRHLVSLVGYCLAGSSQRLLVYEFVPNDTLEHHLHGKGVPVMDWNRRLTIALGSAKGLAYLHEDCHPRIIHRDIKAANILLDEKFEAKVADFGLAKLTTDTNTHVSTRVMGTFGYLAPEYASSGKLTDKSDVFSFGVMLLELITGKRPVDPNNYMEDSLVDWARPLLARALAEDGDFDELIDPRLDNKVDRLELERMAACAAAAVRHSAKRRPKMKQIVRALEGDASLDDLNEGVKPGQSMMFSSSSEYDSAAGNYASNINRFRKVAFDSSDDYSSEYGGTTSEYGLNPSQSSAESSGDQPPRRQHH
ncbi:hypothetical protein PR202_ga26485 [Eleusine coracana subsp. coracana]|uniref:non-specific serine/threonine protein kinase n=1 Tax=Eleusine coracana subsp. coracana TaxID=191504 RepID=A0AAV5DE89_ELECO|nr:hypothetical protein PR202_ga26485 [Eleusine coracana subsp. coracana]